MSRTGAGFAPYGQGEVPGEAPPADAPYRPWEAGPPGGAAAAHDDTFDAPPGLAPAAPVASGARGMRVAGALLLWAGGFLVLGGVAGAAWSGGIVEFMQDSAQGHDPQDVRTARSLQAGALAVAAVAGLPAVVAGAGVLYRQPWALGLGIAAAALQLLIVPFGTLLGIVTLALLTRRRARWWFQ